MQATKETEFPFVLTQHSAQALREIENEKAARSLLSFMGLMWRESGESKPFIPNWHIDCICDHLEAVVSGKLKRLVINIPPRHTKSSTVSVHWPAWVWVRYPGLRFLFTSYAAELATRDSIRCRNVIQSIRYKEIISHATRWPEFSLCGDLNRKTRFENNQGGLRLSTSLLGSNTGEGGDILIADDPHNVNDVESDVKRNATIESFSGAMSTRLDDATKGAVVLIGQRTHHKDLFGYLEDLRDEKYEVLCIPAEYELDDTRTTTHVSFEDPRTEENEPLEPTRIDADSLKRMKELLGPYRAAGQLQQRPAPREGGLLQPHWFNLVESFPRDVVKRVSWFDPAGTKERAGNDPDYFCRARCSLTKDGKFYIEHLARWRETPAVSEKRVKAIAEADKQLRGTRLWIEEEGGSGGKITVDHYVRNVLPGMGLRSERTTQDKVAYADGLSAHAEHGNVFLVKGPWLEWFLDECLTFPNGAHDDGVDAVSKAYRKCQPKRIARAL